MADSTRLPDALTLLHQQARPGELAGMARFGIVGDNRLGLSMPAMRSIAKTLGQDHALATALWDTGIPDARIVAGMVAEPARLTSRQMDAWARDFASWDVCDQVCGSAFLASPLAWRKVPVWAGRQDEFVRRAAFALLATLAVHLGGMPVVWVDNAFFTVAFAVAGLSACYAMEWHDRQSFIQQRTISERTDALQQALASVKTLSSLLPMCAWCRKVRDDQGYWDQVEGYLQRETGTLVSHGICPECEARMMSRAGADADQRN